MCQYFRKLNFVWHHDVTINLLLILTVIFIFNGLLCIFAKYTTDLHIWNKNNPYPPLSKPLLSKAILPYLSTMPSKMGSHHNLWCLESSVNWKEDCSDLIYVYWVCFIFKIVTGKKKGTWEKIKKERTTANTKQQKTMVIYIWQTSNATWWGNTESANEVSSRILIVFLCYWFILKFLLH